MMKTKKSNLKAREEMSRLLTATLEVEIADSVT